MVIVSELEHRRPLQWKGKSEKMRNELRVSGEKERGMKEGRLCLQALKKGGAETSGTGCVGKMIMKQQQKKGTLTFHVTGKMPAPLMLRCGAACLFLLMSVLLLRVGHLGASAGCLPTHSRVVGRRVRRAVVRRQ